MDTVDVWVFRDQSDLGYDPTGGADITGFSVEALDGSIGKVDKANNDVGQATSSSTRGRGSSARR